MPYVKRDRDGQIAAVYYDKCDDAQESIEPEDKELLHFLFQTTGKTDEENRKLQDSMLESDLGMIRVIEDLIETLIEKNVIRITDLPTAAMKRLQTRKAMRSNLSNLTYFLNEPSDKIEMPLSFEVLRKKVTGDDEDK